MKIQGKILIDELVHGSDLPGMPPEEPARGYLVIALDRNLGVDRVVGIDKTDLGGRFSISDNRRSGDYYIRVYTMQNRFVYESRVYNNYVFTPLVINVLLPRDRVYGWVRSDNDETLLNSVWGYDPTEPRAINPIFVAGSRWIEQGWPQGRGLIMRSTGLSWEQVYCGDLNWHAVRGSGQHVFAAGSNHLPLAWMLRSRNFGTTWNHVSFFIEPETLIRGTIYGLWIDTTDSTPMLFAVGAGHPGGYMEESGSILLKSIDAGNTWEHLGEGVPDVCLRGIWGTESSNIFAVGDNGTIIHSTDGGTIWTKIDDVPTDANLWGIWGSSSHDIYVVGERSTILRFSASPQPGGWQLLTSPYDPVECIFLKGVWGSNANDVFVVGERRVQEWGWFDCGGVIVHYDGRSLRDESYFRYYSADQIPQPPGRNYPLSWSAFPRLEDVWGTPDGKHVYAVGHGIYHLDRSGPPGSL